MLKKIIFFFIISTIMFAHGQTVHRYLTYESYFYLKDQLGFDIPVLSDHLGPNVNPNEGTSWSHGNITSGSWLEDDYDVVYGYNQAVPILDFWYSKKSITHFWDADDGDDSENSFIVGGTDLNSGVPGAPFQNAYTKIKKYLNGGWKVYGPNTDYIYEYNGDKVALYDILPQSVKAFYYTNLIDLYKTGVVKLNLASGHYYLKKQNGAVVAQFTGGDIVALKLNEDTKTKVVWEILGRMAHLLQDMSVPAHAHVDAHGIIEDQYEEWVQDNWRYSYWNRNNVGGSFLDVTTYNDPLHFLMYTTQQIAEHFGSSGPFNDGNGDDIIGGDYSVEENNFLLNVNLTSLGQPTYQSQSGFSTAQLTNIRDKTLPHAIRATAGLLYWFAKEADIMPTPPAITVSPTTNYVGSGRAGSYFSGYFNIVNTGGTTLNLDILAGGGGLGFVGESSSIYLQKTLAPGQSKLINYTSSFGRYDYGMFIETVQIYDNSNNIYKTHSVTGTRLLPDFCYGETQSKSASPEELLFDAAFLGYFDFESDSIRYDKNKTIKERLRFAYALLEQPEKEKVENISKMLIELYPESEMGISFYAMGLLWEAAYSIEAPDFSEKEFLEYLINQSNSKNKYKINGYSQLILSLFNVGKDISGLERLFNEYNYDILKELSLYQQFIHYFVYEVDKEAARKISDKLDEMFKESKYGYQAHVMFGDKDYTHDGLLELNKKSQSSLLAKRGEIKTDILSELPTEHKLFSNYPNPFNPSTTIKYSVPVISNVKLSIYNMMGQLVKTLVNETKAPGFYNVQWNSKNENNVKVTSGIYFYRFESGNYVSNNKMILLK